MTALVLLSVRTVAVESVTAMAARRGGTHRVPVWLPCAALTTAAFVAGGLLSSSGPSGWLRIPIDWSTLR